MGSKRIHRHGYIIGGVCDRAHRSRIDRESGALATARYYVKEGLIKHVGGGWYKLDGRDKLGGWREFEEMIGPGTERKIGGYRFTQELVPVIERYGRCFRLKQLDEWCRQLAACEFGVGGESPLGPFKCGLAPPHQDAIFKRRVQDGDLKQPRHLKEAIN